MLNTRQRKLKQKLKRLIFVLLGIYIMVFTALYFLQEQFLFRPKTLAANYIYDLIHDFDELNLKADDGAIINALYIKAENPKGAILYFHGNAGNLQRWGKATEYFVERGYNVLVMDYRTYGKSTGKLSEQVLYDDAFMCYQFLRNAWNDKDITIYGRSLGSAMASKVASLNNPKQLILETPFYSIADVAKHRFPIFPVDYVLKYKLSNYNHLKSVNCPVSIIHGTNDFVVPFSSAKKLYETSSHNKPTFTIVEHGSHNNLIDFEDYHNRILQILP